MLETVCRFCERGCCIDEGGSGFCGLYTNRGGIVEERFPDRYSSIGISHIEGVPFHHVMPGTKTLMLGGAGCNIDCAYCSNAFVARSEPEGLLRHHIPAEEVVKFALKTLCASISFPVNEPAVLAPTLVRVAEAAADAGLPVGMLTNGLMTEETATLLAGSVAFVNVSIKAADDEGYRSLTGCTGLESILRNLRIFHKACHLEVSTPVIQGINDGDLEKIAGYIEAVDPMIPWHVFRLLPEYRMAGTERPNIEVVVKKLEELKKRIPFLYFGNFVGSRWVGTDCPSCGREVIERINLGGCGAKCVKNSLVGGHCPHCGAEVRCMEPYAGNGTKEAV